MAGLIALAGSLAQKPRHGGHAWVFLQHLLGFRRLGWDVLFLDQVDGRATPPEQSSSLAFVRDLMERVGLGDSFAVLIGEGSATLGLAREEVLKRVERAEALLNVMGFLRDEEILARARCRVFLDIDPGFPQMWRALGLHDPFRGHDRFVTIAERIGQPDCLVPPCGLEWIPTRQPIVLEHWPAQRDPGHDAFTTVATWRGAYGPIEYQGQRFGLRVHEFRQFAPLPRRTGQRFEVALDIHPAETRDRELLQRNGWRLVDPRQAAGDPWRYQRYVQRSRAEFQVAKEMYVRSRGGWFSDRSICYLASGRPVLAQDTGLAGLYPQGEGLLLFRTLGEAVAAVESVVGDYPRHARAARALAEGYFDSDRVLGRLLARLGLA